MVTVDYEQRTHLAILNEFAPNWREQIVYGSARFAEFWVRVTGQSQTSAFRWAARAKGIAASEQDRAA